MSQAAYDYVAGGAGSEDTVRANLDAFRRHRLVPRYLRDVSLREMSVELLGTRLPARSCRPPIGVLGILHKDAELAVARAAAPMGVPVVLSTLSSTPMEQVAEAMGDAPRWFQLYWPRSDELAASFVQAPSAGSRNRGDARYIPAGLARARLRNAYLPFFRGDGLANYFTDPVFRQAVGGDPLLHPMRTAEISRTCSPTRRGPGPTWNDCGNGRGCRSSSRGCCTHDVCAGRLTMGPRG